MLWPQLRNPIKSPYASFLCVSSSHSQHVFSVVRQQLWLRNSALLLITQWHRPRHNHYLWRGQWWNRLARRSRMLRGIGVNHTAGDFTLQNTEYSHAIINLIHTDGHVYTYPIAFNFTGGCSNGLVRDSSAWRRTRKSTAQLHRPCHPNAPLTAVVYVAFTPSLLQSEKR